MVIGLMAYLYKGGTVVFNKGDIKNAKDQDFEEVRVFINYKDIKEWAEKFKDMEQQLN